ncbi:MAG: N-acetylglucosamine-6-phosphate deacetylase [Oscillospiraceae bacterium]|nr:N-acetylglucosamine-6-phosphate deacetylase [Oscillospiraceae bacterium]
MLIANGNIFGENGNFRRGNMEICGGIISAINYSETSDEEYNDIIINADGLYVLPGLVDIHLHGAAGYDFCDGTAEAFRVISDFELFNGVTSIVPATMTLPQENLAEIMAAIERFAKKNSQIKGITMEGPFISAEKKGAQNELYIQKPNIKLFNSLQEAAGGLIKQVIVAPEIEGAIEFIKEVSANCAVSLAHTNAAYEEAAAAFQAGANHVTHLYNAMPPFGHREPGVAGAAFDNKNVFAELICDGMHIHPSAVRAAFQLFGANRICMISDSMSATGMGEGEFLLGGQKVKRKGAKAILENGSLAGAVSTLYDDLKTAVLKMNIPLENAVLACTATPARSLKLEQECGILAVGRRADMVLLDKALNIKYVIKDGVICHAE